MDPLSSPHRLRTAVLVNLAAILERCDEQMLPAVYRFIGASWSASPTQLGYITLCRALVQALSAPIGGIAGHCLHRGKVIGCGCLLWAALTAAFACSHSLGAGAAIWAVNGLGLALVLPNTQSLIADLFAAVQRGRAFGMLYLTGAIGGMLGALYATNIASHRPLGLEGWRFAFLSLAAVSAAAGVANLLLTEDTQWQQQQQLQWQQEGGKQQSVAAAKEATAPRGRKGRQWHAAAGGAAAGADAPAGLDETDIETQPLQQGKISNQPGSVQGSVSRSGRTGGSPQQSQTPPETPPLSTAPGHLREGSWQLPPRPPLAARLRGVWSEIGQVVRIPTFLIIVAQGIMGSIPWNALVFLTLYLQLLGMSDAQASFLVALFLAGCAIGGLIGGCVGDAAAKHWPHHGRIAVTQFSVSIGIPFACLIFKGLPQNGSASTVAIYAAVLLCFALLKSWPAPACNNPVFAEIVPAQQRNLVYAFDRCFEGAIAACAAPLVGMLAERLFGFTGSGTVTHDREADLANALALGNALLTFLVVPWSFTLLMYTGLHWTYPTDKAAALKQQLRVLRERGHQLEESHIMIDRLSSTGVPSTESSIELLAAPSEQGRQQLYAAEEQAVLLGGSEAGSGRNGSNRVVSNGSGRR